MLDNNEFKGLCDALEGRNLQSGWWSTESFSDDFDTRRKIFFWIFERLLKEGHIKLAKHGKFLDGSIEEQIECFRQALPHTEAEMEDGIWFFDDACPGGAVWVFEDGRLEWT